MSALKVWAVSMAFLVAGPSGAHEYWIEPLDFALEAGEPMQAYLKVGQDFNGSTYPFVPGRFKAFTVTDQTGTQDYIGRAGDSPAVQVDEPKEGLNIITYHSQPDNLVYRREDLLEKYLKAEGLERVLEQHRADGLAETGFSEDYTRNAKALVQIGGYQGGADKAVGLPFELVVQGSPYVPETDVVRVQLLWQGAPMAAYPINVFTDTGTVVQSRVQTDGMGFAEIAFPGNGKVLLNSVYIQRTAEGRQAFYESWWASTTFGR